MAMNDQPKQCPVCGETDPYPAWFCLMRAIGNAKQGEPCTYSREGKERMATACHEKAAHCGGEKSK